MLLYTQCVTLNAMHNFTHSTPPASKVHCSINGLENSSSPEYSKVQHFSGSAVELFSIGVGLFLVGGGLFLSPTVAEKSPTPAEKSPTAILKRCWTLEYFGELEFSSPFMEQWTLDARGVLCFKFYSGAQGERRS